ncbi:hypothetical protein F511_02874 [Dorcoceras hygrometricum]|uniref:C3HC-type domain-containing protein n=1 Tax=Dorcoceras hygrometricum TaxID=472368 RepID=A0A2Z7AJL3_9LAMI|nr:hypothetical protein F511_02874 [Dorcoceras hygrometricum]
MGEETEKRFEAIMNKLFGAPHKSRLNSAKKSMHGVQSVIGKKRSNSSYASASAGVSLSGIVVRESESSSSATAASSQASPCRPWDRNDLFQRLSTFKSMTWFAKPQVVSPVNCARRGWINVDIDIIAFEKAALVFSLKLESGHKLLCPWMNSACSEELAQFPTMSRDALIEDYKKRYDSLSQLPDLPMISPLAVDNMRNPMLKDFLREFPTSMHLLPDETSREDCVFDEPGSISSVSFYQAQKLISLCGWEPHMLPYIVDVKDGECQSISDTNIMVSNRKRQKVSVCSLVSVNEDAKDSAEFDLSSVVLNCNLCGASVGLWAFRKVPRPVEYVRLVGFTEVNGVNDSASDKISAPEGSPNHLIHTGSREGMTDAITTASSSLGVTIAGGPPPAMLNYNASISLPVIGKSLIDRIPTQAESKDQLGVKELSKLVKGPYMSPGRVNTATDRTLGATGADAIATNTSEVLQIAAEDSSSNVNMVENETERTNVDQCVSSYGEFSRQNTQDNFISKNGEAGKGKGENMVEARNYEQDNNQRPDPKLPSDYKAMKFDPIKQHRHFCPWIVLGSNFSPGWQQTLYALHENKEFPFSSLRNMTQSSVIEVNKAICEY